MQEMNVPVNDASSAASQTHARMAFVKRPNTYTTPLQKL